MRFIGLTGGIGSGKSTVARMLAERGAVILDSDVLAHEVVEPGTPGFEDVVARFGPEIVTAEGGVDRPALARVVFADDEARGDLEAIVHPLVRRRVAEEVAARVGTKDVVVLDSPLLIETGTYRDCQQVLVVSTLPETQIRRLVARGMDEADARARLATQMPLEDKVAFADVVFDNEGTLEELEAQVDRFWRSLS